MTIEYRNSDLLNPRSRLARRAWRGNVQFINAGMLKQFPLDTARDLVSDKGDYRISQDAMSGKIPASYVLIFIAHVRRHLTKSLDRNDHLGNVGLPSIGIAAGT
jgi:hypothetical protein